MVSKHNVCPECKIRPPLLKFSPFSNLSDSACMTCLLRVVLDPIREHERIIREFRDLGKGG